MTFVSGRQAESSIFYRFLVNPLKYHAEKTIEFGINSTEMVVGMDYMVDASKHPNKLLQFLTVPKPGFIRVEDYKIPIIQFRPFSFSCLAQLSTVKQGAIQNQSLVFHCIHHRLLRRQFWASRVLIMAHHSFSMTFYTTDNGT